MAVRLAVLCNLVAEIRKAVSRFTAEPKIRTEFERLLIEHDPDDAARRLFLQLQACRYFCRRCSPMARLQLHVPHHAITVEHHVVPSPVDLGTQDLDVSLSPAPERS